VPPVLRLIGVSGPAPESPDRGGGESVPGPGGAGDAGGRLGFWLGVARRCSGGLRPLARSGPFLVAGRHARLGAAAAGWRAQRRRSIMTTSTMITIRTMVPIPINMGFLSDARGHCGTRLCAPGWAGTGRDGGLSRAALGDAAREARAGYFLKASLIFSPACLRSPLA
jgi:hypothetical protein